MLINELVGNYFEKVYRANTGMPIWDSSICYNDTHPRFRIGRPEFDPRPGRCVVSLSKRHLLPKSTGNTQE